MKEALERAKPEPMPARMRPMELPDREYPPFDEAGWLFENKYDGYRMLARIDGDNIQLFSHNLDSSLLNKRAESIVPTLSQIHHQVILDGELVVIDEDGLPTFALVHNFKKGVGTVEYYVFDALHVDGYNLTGTSGLSLWERKLVLREVLPEELTNVHYVDYVEEKGIEKYEEAKEFGIEGIVAKPASSLYFPGRTSPRWRKIRKNYIRDRFNLTSIYRE